MPADLVGELHLPRVLRLRAAGRTLVLAKRSGESTAHVILKAIAYARYAPAYEDLRIEVPIGMRFKPDLIALDADGAVRLWIECGKVDRDKVRWLVRRYPQARIVWLRRQAQWAGAIAIVREALAGVKRTAPVEIIGVTDEAMLGVIERGDADVAADAAAIATLPDAGPDTMPHPTGSSVR